MKKKLGVLLLLVLVVTLCFSLTGCKEMPYNVELLQNGKFEATDTISGWKPDIYDKNKVAYTATPETDNNFINITNKSIITSNLYQNVSVEKGATYKITAKFKISSPIAGSTGFSIGFLENKEFNPLHYTFTSGNDWQIYELYITPDMDNVNLCIRLGGQGTVSVDDVSMVKVDPNTVPSSHTVYLLKVAENLPYNKTAGGITFAVLMTLLTVVIMLVAYYLLRRVASNDNFLPCGDNEKISITNKISLSPIGMVGIIMAIGFVVRFILATTLYCYDGIYNNEASLIANIGLAGYFYTNNTITAPGYMYYLALFGLLKKTTAITGVMGISIMLKLPSILADIAIIYLLFSFGRKYVGDKNAGIFSLLYAILPPVFMLNAGWGGTESLAVLGILAIFICIVEKKNLGLFFSSLYSIMFSMETVYVLPLVLAYLVIQCIKDKKFILNAVLGSVAFFVAFYLLTLPITINYVKIGLPFVIFTRYYDVLAGNALAAVNNFSIFAIMGLNNQLASKATFIVSIIFVMFVWAYAIYCYVSHRNRLNLLLMAGFSMLTISAFAVNQTKTTAVVGATLLLVYALISRDKRIFMLSGGFYTLNAMNIFTLFDMAGYFAKETNRYEMFMKFDWVQVLGSVLMVILVIILMFVVFDICITERRKEIQPIYDNEVLSARNNIKEKLKIKKGRSK